MKTLGSPDQRYRLPLPLPGVVQEAMIPPFQYAMIDGAGSPGSPEFQQAVAALYRVSFDLKLARMRAEPSYEYSIGPLEALWWMVDNMPFDDRRPQDWRWTAMIMQPPVIGSSEFFAAIAKLQRAKPNPALDLLRLETFYEGKIIQVLHVGPYSTEGSSTYLLEEYRRSRGYSFNGKHHEIYLNDARRTRPEKLRTILRWPVAA